MKAAGFPIPRNLADAFSLDDGGRRRAWFAALPAAVKRLERLWSLDVGVPFQPGGQTAWVAPARTRRGDVVVVKIAWRHPEADHEPDGLRVWGGDGAIRLFASEEYDATTVLMMVEWCEPGTPLTSRPEPEQDRVIASLLQRLWRTPPSAHRFRPLRQMCDSWADEF